ncbi:MAG: hypothetical protein ACOCT9_00050 [archaeon]
MIGTNKKTRKKAKIELEIPEKSLKPMRDEFGVDIINDLLMLGKNRLPEEAPYVITMNKFYLKSINRSPKDRTQIIETNEYPLFFGFGEGAELHKYSITVLAGGKENFLEESSNWIDTYEDFFTIARPHNIIDYNLRFNISYSNRSYDGLWFGMVFNENAEMDKIVGVSFNFFVTNSYEPVELGEE